MIGRRAILAGSGSLWLAVGARGQNSPRPVVGFLNNQSLATWQRFVDAFIQGLNEGGFKLGETVDIEYRWAEGRNDRLAALAAELVARRVDVLVATGGADTIKAAKAATSVIPIVFTLGSDPVGLGVVDSISRPGGNVTGVALFTFQLAAKRLELLRETIPSANDVGILFNPANSNMPAQIADLRAAAGAMRIGMLNAPAKSQAEIEATIARFAKSGAGALLVTSDSLFFSLRAEIAASASKHRLPAIFETRDYVEAGGLMSYGVDFAHGYRRAGRFAAQILKGAKPSELPVEQPTRFELVINLKTAKALGITIPPSVAIRADEVIE